MDRFDIYNAAQKFHDCSDLRPWLIIDNRATDVFACFPIASESYCGIGFQLDKAHPDFRATGLTKTCYVLDERLFDLSLAIFGKQRGRLANNLLASFREYAGL